MNSQYNILYLSFNYLYYMRSFLILLFILNIFAQSQEEKDKLVSCQLSDDNKTFDLRKL